MKSRTGTRRSMSEADADKRAERPERPGKVAAEPPEGRGLSVKRTRRVERRPGTRQQGHTEEVLRREDVLAAHTRAARNGGAAGVDGMTLGPSDGLLPRALDADELPARRLRRPDPAGRSAEQSSTAGARASFGRSDDAGGTSRDQIPKGRSGEQSGPCGNPARSFHQAAPSDAHDRAS